MHCKRPVLDTGEGGTKNTAHLSYHYRAPQNFECKWFNTGALSKVKCDGYCTSFPRYSFSCVGFQLARAFFHTVEIPLSFFSLDLVCKGGKRRNHFPYFFVGLYSYVSLLTDARSWRSVNSWLQPLLWPTPTSPSHVLYFFGCWGGTECTAGYSLELGAMHRSLSKWAMRVWKLLYGNLESLEIPENNNASTI